MPNPGHGPARRPSGVQNPAVAQSSLPQLIPPQTTLFGRVNEAGDVTIDVNWYLYLYNLSRQVFPIGGNPPVITQVILEQVPAPPVFFAEDGDGGGGDVIPGPPGLPGAPGPAGPIGIGLDGADGDDGLSIPGTPGPAGNPGSIGATGPVGATAISIAFDGEEGQEGFPLPGPQGPSGTPGSTGSSGPAGPAVYLEAPEADEPMAIPGPSGAAGSSGSTGSQGPTGPAVYLEAQEADDPVTIPGPAGASGSTGAQGPSGPAVYLEAPEADEPFFHLGSQGPSGAQGPSGPAAHFSLDPISDIDVMSEALSAYSAFDQDTGIVSTAGGLTASTTINDTVTYTTGGATLVNQIAASGSTWRVRAHGTFVAVSSVTARNAQVAAFWGATQLPAIAVAILVSTGQTTTWEVEFILAASSTTAVWTSGYLHNEIASATLRAQTNATPASTTVTAGGQTLDLRFSMAVAVATDQWVVQNVTLERLK